jgi:hypothetical protein
VDDEVDEFTCRSCNQHVIRIIPSSAPPICAHCVALPGWHKNPKLFRIFGRKDMKLMHVTFTGADDSCRPEELLYLSRHYLNIEWGVLLSRSQMGAERFPSLGWINELQRRFKDTPHKLSLHLCGSLLRELMVGNDFIPPELVDGFQRVQLNFHGEPVEFKRDKCVAALSKAFGNREIIFQIDGAQGEEILAAVHDGKQTFNLRAALRCEPRRRQAARDLADPSHLGRAPSAMPAGSDPTTSRPSSRGSSSRRAVSRTGSTWRRTCEAARMAGAPST